MSLFLCPQRSFWPLFVLLAATHIGSGFVSSSAYAGSKQARVPITIPESRGMCFSMPLFSVMAYPVASWRIKSDVIEALFEDT